MPEGAEGPAERVRRLKRERRALVLVHTYQPPELYDVADLVGDSLELCRAAQGADADAIVFCGVDFMAESAAVLNPGRRVVIPEPEARCPMAAMATARQVAEARRRRPGAAVVAYVNSSAAVKAASDVCCTSANAVRVVESLDEEEAIVLPDRNLALYVASRTKKRVVPWEGHCYVHSRITADEVRAARAEHPRALVLVHPECPPEVVALADSVESTSGMLRAAKASDAEEVVVVTERGVAERLRREAPGKRCYSVGGVCLQMKKGSLAKLASALERMGPAVTVPEGVARGARRALERMLEVG